MSVHLINTRTVIFICVVKDKNNRRQEIKDRKIL